ncbi:MAG: restriction endonuclease [bacterium]
MTKTILAEGQCPNCKATLKFDNNDRISQVILCPVCQNKFEMSSALCPIQFGQTTDDFNLIKQNIEILYTTKGKFRGYKGYISHSGLNKAFSTPTNPDINYIQKRLNEQALSYKHKWQDYKIKEFNGSKAVSFSEKAENEIKSLDNILIDSVENPIKFKWEDYKNHENFNEPRPQFTSLKPEIQNCEPKEDLWEILFGSEKNKKLRKENFEKQISEWNEKKSIYDKSVSDWEQSKEKFIKEQEEFNSGIEREKKLFEEGDPEMITKYFTKILIDSVYPQDFPENVFLQYKKDEKLLLIDYELPTQDVIPQYRGEKFNKTTGSSEQILLSENEKEKIYDKVLYSIPIRTINEVFSNDETNSIDAIAFNGFVDILDKSTGNHKIIYILSVFVKKQDFLQLNLLKIDPKLCLRGLKGICSSKLTSLAPIAPIMSIDKSDKRFIEAREVIGEMEDQLNIAAMDWEDFEHLVREVFEKEFAQSGMEVKITQSSRDLGVDAVAFDPDPLRGGKIIIQAKRYTNTVKVESVRALYGIMQDEGAMKGIIVTTSDYGPDAYKFAQGKPITLINGNNLLSLLDKYGKKARINLEDAKKVLKSE